MPDHAPVERGCQRHIVDCRNDPRPLEYWVTIEFLSKLVG